MKKKKTSHVKKKEKKVEEHVEELSLIDRARGEKNMSLTAYSHPDGKQYTRKAFEMWMTLPDQFKGAPERITALLGINDPVLLELLKYPTMQSFAEEFGVIPATLSRWRGEMESGGDFLNDVKKEMRKLTRNVIGSLYRKMLEDGDATRAMAWMKIVEDWREQLGIEHSGDIGDGLSVEEKKALDHLLLKNTKP